jgi:ABC-type Zn uptake system ZnuABC Zn-binding protein ZnuA
LASPSDRFAAQSGKLPVLMVAGLALLALTGCVGTTAQTRSAASGAVPGPVISVVTSITVLADLIRQVGGERVEVRALVPSGADPQTFQPAPRHVVPVANADIVFLNGLGLDRTVRTVVNNAARSELPVVVLAEGLSTVESSFPDPDGSQPGPGSGTRANPYLWLDPHLALQYVDRIESALSALDPAGAVGFRTNAARFAEVIRTLDAEVEAELSTIPARNRKLVTVHDGFPYFAERYGFTVVAIVMKTPGREPTAQEIVQVARVIREERVPAVFTQPQINSRILKLAARDAGIQISTLYSDTLDAAVPSYEALLRYNARHLVNGLR